MFTYICRIRRYADRKSNMLGLFHAMEEHEDTVSRMVVLQGAARVKLHLPSSS